MNKKLNKKQKRISPNTTAIIATITILIGGFFLFNNYVQAKKEIAYDYISNVFYEDDNLQKIKEVIVEQEEKKSCQKVITMNILDI